jgi:hypothetical protein
MTRNCKFRRVIGSASAGPPSAPQPGPKALSQFKAEHIAVEGQRPFQIGHLQMNVSDADFRMNRL